MSLGHINETQKRRLSQFLLERTIESLSGRDNQDIVDGKPSRLLYGGVLLPSSSSASGQTSQASNSIGIDARVKADPAVKEIHLAIEVGWSVYYSVFPKWEDVRRKAQISGPTVLGGSTELKDDQISSKSAASLKVDSAVNERKGLTLPVAFRRIQIPPIVCNISCDLTATGVKHVELPKLSEAMHAARERVLSDQSVWRHLDAPSKWERTIRFGKPPQSEVEYHSMLQKIQGEKAVPPDWKLGITLTVIREPNDPNGLRIQLLLSNDTSAESVKDEDPGLLEKALFDTKLQVEITNGEFIPFDFFMAPSDYRRQPQMPAKGINCAVHASGGKTNCLSTECFPVFEQPLLRTRPSKGTTFAALSAEDCLEVLDSVASDMAGHLELWDSYLSENCPLGRAGVEACRKDRNEYAAEIDRYRRGVKSLRSNPVLLNAFKLMNQAFLNRSKKSGATITEWRLFQICFIVSQLPSLASRHVKGLASSGSVEKTQGERDKVAILWFPTGGGKTEAYLGLISTAILFDRLRGKSRGVTAWMRFPLRMLSMQQLERLASVLSALNEIRAGDKALLIGDPFSIGFYVGGTVTPNRLDEDMMRRVEKNESERTDLLLLRKCPHCGSKLSIQPIRKAWRIAHVCPNDKCFTNASSSLGELRGSVPLFVIDNEIYRYMPSVLVGTIDKLAVMGFNKHFAHIVRGANQKCGQHGYASYDKCVEANTAQCRNGKSALARLTPIEDPGPSLLIQDELHLLKEELGVFDAHYEGLLQHLGKKACAPPKVLAATATIESYEEHAYHLYLMTAERFPVPSWEVGESFYATSSPFQCRRLYVGILNHNRSAEDPVLRLLSLYWREIRLLERDTPRLTAILGLDETRRDEALGVLRLYDLSLCYVLKKGTGGSIVDKSAVIDRFLEEQGLDGITARLLTGDQGSDLVAQTIEQIESELYRSDGKRLNVLVATNLISHGVDLERINMMVATGMPSHYAEYVQATSRCARSHPGLVFTLFNAKDPREQSQFEFFTPLHENLERLIEPVAVNRFSTYAPEKTIPGLLFGVLLNDLTPDLYGSAIRHPLDSVNELQTALGLKASSPGKTSQGCVDRDYLTRTIGEIIGVDDKRDPAREVQIEILRRRIEEITQDQLDIIGRSHEPRLNDVLTPMTSFRDIDEGISFESVDSASLVSRLKSK